MLQGNVNLIAAASGWLDSTINYELIRGNPIWRFGAMLIVITISLATGRIVQYMLTRAAARSESKRGTNVAALLLGCLSKPAYVAIFAIGLFFCKLCLYFHDELGIQIAIGNAWVGIVRAVGAIAVAYAMYRLVDIVEHYLTILTSRTATKLDDMLVPVARKSLRIAIAIFAILFIAETIFGAQQIKTILLSAGVGGIAVALAAKDTVANFFGSITIFADRPFQVDEMVKIGEHTGPIEEVGFRSTRIRTLQGHLVTIPNHTVANSMIENIGKRPFIRRTSNITITYNSGHEKARRAVEVIKDILANTPEVNTASDRPPRVYFSDFNDCSLNIYMTYWVKPPDYWLYNEVNERVNLEMMKRFEAEGIEFAFPTQTLYVKKDEPG